MFASMWGILGNQWFWVVALILGGLIWLAKEVSKAASGVSNTVNNPVVKGFWSIFNK